MNPLVKLAWSPRSLARASASCSDLAAVLIGGACFGVVVSALVMVGAWGINSPYPTVRVYLLSGLRCLAAIPIFAVIGIVIAALLMASVPRSEGSSRAEMRAAFLSAVPLLFPALVWFPLAVLASMTVRRMVLTGIPL